MKTGQYYFDKLSEVEQKEFVENYDNLDIMDSIKDYLKDKFPSHEMFIKYAFSWFGTKQEYDYWQNIANRKVD